MVSGRSPSSLAVWMNGERVGTWTPARRSAARFDYDSHWPDSRHARALSLSLPFLPDNAPHRGAHVDAWFDNLLPDGRRLRERIASRFRTASLDPFDLLAAIGRDCVGAVQLLPPDADPGDVRTIDATALTDADVAARLRHASADPRLEDEQRTDFRISIAGAQEKTALLRMRGAWYLPHRATPTTHILKLPLGLVGNLRVDLRDSVENEWFCMQFLAELGLGAPETEIVRVEDDQGDMTALSVRRFDREFIAGSAHEPAWIARLPQEDFCQATGMPPERKYESDGGPGVASVLRILQGSRDRARDTVTFALAQLAFWLLAAPDGHAKNFSLFHMRDGYRLTPLYDVLSSWPVIGIGRNEWAYQTVRLAMAIRGSRPYRKLDRIAVRHWRQLARATTVPDVFAQMVDMVERAEEALARVERRVPVGFPEHVQTRIADGLRRHRTRFLDALVHESE